MLNRQFHAQSYNYTAMSKLKTRQNKTIIFLVVNKYYINQIYVARSMALFKLPARHYAN